MESTYCRLRIQQEMRGEVMELDVVFRVAGVQGECRALGRQGWAWAVGKAGSNARKSTSWSTLKFAKITLMACEGRMKEARVWRVESNLGSFFSHKMGEQWWGLQLSQNVDSVILEVTPKPITHQINRCSSLRESDRDWAGVLLCPPRPFANCTIPPTAFCLGLLSSVLSLSSFLWQQGHGRFPAAQHRISQFPKCVCGLPQIMPKKQNVVEAKFVFDKCWDKPWKAFIRWHGCLHLLWKWSMIQTVSFCLIALDEIMTVTHHSYYWNLLYRKKTYFNQS